MQENEILDAMPVDQSELEKQIKDRNKKYAFIIAGLIIFNTIIHTTVLRRGADAYQTGYNFGTNLSVYSIGMAFYALVIGAVVAAFPYKGLPYGKKYWRGAVLTMLTLQVFMAFSMMLLFIMFLMGSFPPPK